MRRGNRAARIRLRPPQAVFLASERNDRDGGLPDHPFWAVPLRSPDLPRPLERDGTAYGLRERALRTVLFNRCDRRSSSAGASKSPRYTPLAFRSGVAQLAARRTV